MSQTRGLALILGLGRFGGGQEAAKFLHRRGWRLRIADQASAEELAGATAALEPLDAIEWALGRDDPGLLDGVGLVVVNPAVPTTHPLLQAILDRDLKVSQEANLFLEHYPGRVILVTGTNGKSTTSTLIASALSRGGRSALLGGNIGHSLLAEEASWHQDQFAVLEISSFQLERIDPARHRVMGCVLTRITEDHLDRHGSLASYRSAKARAAAAAEEFVVHCAEDPIAGGFPSPARKRLRYTGGTAEDADIDWHGDWLQSRLGAKTQPILHVDALTLLGSFHRENVAAAAAVTREIGIDRGAAGLALCLTKALPYRLQKICDRDGIHIYDNSVSTELQSTLSAVRAIHGPVHWVGGGKSKDGNYRRVAVALAPLIRSAHLFGAAAAPLAAEFSEQTEITTHHRLEEALTRALELAPTGATILFSPGFASFDQFKNFRQRGEAFHSWIQSSLPENQ